MLDPYFHSWPILKENLNLKALEMYAALIAQIPFLPIRNIDEECYNQSSINFEVNITVIYWLQLYIWFNRF